MLRIGVVATSLGNHSSLARQLLNFGSGRCCLAGTSRDIAEQSRRQRGEHVSNGNDNGNDQSESVRRPIVEVRPVKTNVGEDAMSVVGMGWGLRERRR